MRTLASFHILRSLSVLLLISVASFAQVGPDQWCAFYGVVRELPISIT